MPIKQLLTAALIVPVLGACANAVRLQSDLAPSTYDYTNFTVYQVFPITIGVPGDRS